MPGNLKIPSHKSFSISCVAFSDDGRFLLSGDLDGNIKLWDVATGREIKTFKGNTTGIKYLSFFPDHPRFLYQSDEDVFIVHDIISGEIVFKTERKFDEYSIACLSPDGKLLAWADNTGENIQVLDIDVSTGSRVLEVNENMIRCLLFTADSRFLVYGEYNDGIKVVDNAYGFLVKTMQANNCIESLSVSDDAKVLVAGVGENALQAWDLESGLNILDITEEGLEPKSVKVSPAGTYVVGFNRNNQKVILWDIPGGNIVREINAGSLQIDVLAITPDSSCILTSGRSGLKLWNAGTGDLVKTFDCDYSTFHKMYFSQDSSSLTAIAKNTMMAFSLIKGSLELCTKINNEEFSKAVKRPSASLQSPDGKYSLIQLSLRDWYPAGTEYQYELIDNATKAVINTFNLFSKYDEILIFSPRGESLAVGLEKTIEIYNVPYREKTFILSGHLDEISCACFSDDGKYLFTGSFDDNILMWDLEKGSQMRQFSGHDDWITSLNLHPNGKMLISSGNDNTIRIWDIISGEELALIASPAFGEWIVVTPDGYYDGSEIAIKLSYCISGIDVFDLTKFNGMIHKPGLLHDIFSA